MAGSLDADLLKSFVAVAETHSFTKAALQLHHTQSTVSLQIKKLEEMAGTILLQRTTRSLSLTPAGEKFLVYAKQILKLQHEALSVSAGLERFEVVKLGLPEDYAPLIVPVLLRELAKQDPRLRLHITCATSALLLDQLKQGDLDLVLTIRADEPSDGHALCEEQIVWAANPAFALASDQPVPLAVYPQGCPFRARALNALASIGRDSQVVYTSQNPTGIEVAVREGLGVTVRSRRTLPTDWKVLGPEDGFPPLPPAELELHRSPTALHGANDRVERLLAAQF
jgi:DNA-binding transcriptional LysR family regulator